MIFSDSKWAKKIIFLKPFSYKFLDNQNKKGRPLTGANGLGISPKICRIRVPNPPASIKHVLTIQSQSEIAAYSISKNLIPFY